jgi:ketosteroid isomerase-like protein
MKSILLSLSLLLLSAFAQAQSANLKTVMDGYAKFGAGDIPGIIASLAPDVVWSHDGDPAIIPFAGMFKGQAEVGRFFEAVAKSVQVKVFNPTNFREEGNRVINDCHIEGIVIATGKTYADDVVMTWTFGPDGKVIAWSATGTMAGLTAALK